MKNLLASLFRKIVSLFIKKKHSYLLGMIIIRLSRFCRRKFYKDGQSSQFEIIPNCLGNIKMRLDINSYMGGSIFWCGFHHVNEIIYLNNFLKNDMVFIDIGANQGEFSLFAASKLIKGKVISFEPVGYQYNMLKKNIELNNFNNVEINKFGLSNRTESLPIYTSSNSDLHSGVHEGLSTLFKSESRSELQETVQLKVFDEIYFEFLNRLDFVKIDIEGAELFALKGMIKTLSKFKPDILIEISEETFKAAGYDVKEMLNFLDSLNYKPYKIHRGNLFSFNDPFSDWGNYIFKN